MSSSTEMCSTAREWASAHRDGEAPLDERLHHHATSCPACTRWAAGLDVVTRTTRLRAPAAPAELRGSLPALGPARTSPALDRTVWARWMLATAALTGLVAVGLGMAGVAGHAHFGTIDGRDAWGLKLALLVGFAIAAWRPQRHVAGLLPIATISGVVTVAMSVTALARGETTFAGELLHLPIILGAVGAALAFRPATARARNEVSQLGEAPRTTHV